MSLNQASFTLTLSSALTSTVAVDYTTYDDTATAYADYVKARGTVVWNPGDPLTQVIVTNVIAPTTALTPKAFGLRLSNFRNVAAGSKTQQEVTISGAPDYPLVPFPGRRAAILGDSTSYMCHHWNPPSLSTGQSPVPRYEFYGTGQTGWWMYLNAILGNAFELEPAMQPNTNPGANSTAPNNGYNFAIYSSKVSQWYEPDFDPLAPETPTAHNVGCMVNAVNYAASYDCAFILGGTNDVSGGADASLAPSILNQIISDAYDLAKLGKWVFVMTIMPRTTDLLQANNGIGGYTDAQMLQIFNNILYINQGLRDWAATNPKNIFLCDVWADMVGPTASVVPGTPTDPHGQLSPASGYGLGTNLPSVPGNYRTTDSPVYPQNKICFDGLHENASGGYIMGKNIAAVCTAAGVPGPLAGALGPLTIGPNLLPTGVGTWTVSSTPRALGQVLTLGRSTCLGTPVGWSSPGFPAGYSGGYIDHNANQGQGYQYGPVPDYTFIYRLFNGIDLTTGAQTAGDGPTPVAVSAQTPIVEESYSNYMQYTFTSFTAVGPGNSAPIPKAYTVDSTFAAGALTTSIVNVNGVRGLQLNVNFPSGLTKNEGFVIRITFPGGQHGPWDNYGFENSGSASPAPTPPYSAGDFIRADCVMNFANMTGKFQDLRMVCEFLSINHDAVATGDNSTSGAVVSGICGVESYFPFSNIANNQQFNVPKSLALATSAVKVPTPATGENLQYGYLEFQFSWDCSTQGATATITILSPRVAKLTGPAL